MPLLTPIISMLITRHDTPCHFAATPAIDAASFDTADAITLSPFITLNAYAIDAADAAATPHCYYVKGAVGA